MASTVQSPSLWLLFSKPLESSLFIQTKPDSKCVCVHTHKCTHRRSHTHMDLRAQYSSGHNYFCSFIICCCFLMALWSSENDRLSGVSLKLSPHSLSLGSTEPPLRQRCVKQRIEYEALRWADLGKYGHISLGSIYIKPFADKKKSIPFPSSPHLWTRGSLKTRTAEGGLSRTMS